MRSWSTWLILFWRPMTKIWMVILITQNLYRHNKPELRSGKSKLTKVFSDSLFFTSFLFLRVDLTSHLCQCVKPEMSLLNGSFFVTPEVMFFFCPNKNSTESNYKWNAAAEARFDVPTYYFVFLFQILILIVDCFTIIFRQGF